MNGTLVYTGDKTDEIMNYCCGGTIVVFMLVGLLVNSNLIIHLKVKRPSWIDKFLFYLSWFRLFYVIMKGLMLSYMFFNDRTFAQIVYPDIWFRIMGIISLIGFTAIVAIDGTIVVIQCCNVHFPSWSLLTGSHSKMTKRVTMVVVTVLMISILTSNVYGYVYHVGINDIPLRRQIVTDMIIGNFPALMLGIFVLCIYSYTWIRFWRQTGAIHISSTIKREFKLVALLVAFDTIFTVSIISFLINLITFSQSNVRFGVYIWVFSDAMVPLIGSAVVSCYTLLIVKEGMLSRGLIRFRQGLDGLSGSLRTP